MASRALTATLLLSLLLASYAAETFDSGKTPTTTRVLYPSLCFLASASTGRELLQRKKDGKKKQTKGKSKLTSKEREERAEAKREAQALADFEKAQKRREKEKEAVIKSARKDAENEVVKFNRAGKYRVKCKKAAATEALFLATAVADEKAQIAVFVNLWKNAKGPTILRLLTTLVSSSQTSRSYYLNSETSLRDHVRKLRFDWLLLQLWRSQCWKQIERALRLRSPTVCGRV